MSVSDLFLKNCMRFAIDGVSTHDMDSHNCKCISILDRTKGASSFALDIQVCRVTADISALLVLMNVIVLPCTSLIPTLFLFGRKCGI